MYVYFQHLFFNHCFEYNVLLLNRTAVSFLLRNFNATTGAKSITWSHQTDMTASSIANAFIHAADHAFSF